METTVEVEALQGGELYRVTVTAAASQTVHTRSLTTNNPDDVIIEAGMVRLIYEGRHMTVQKHPDFDGGVHEIVEA